MPPPEFAAFDELWQAPVAWNLAPKSAVKMANKEVAHDLWAHKTPVHLHLRQRDRFTVAKGEEPRPPLDVHAVNAVSGADEQRFQS
jgi:hypothetical protein